jgi:hypothetical protein
MIYRGSQVRGPVFSMADEPVSPRSKIEQLEDYILITARWRAHLQEAELHATERLKELRKKWETMQGWEQYRRKGEKTKASVDDAKRQADPALWGEIQDYEWLVESAMRQVRRLEHDYEAASRTYTTITGGV